MPYAVYITRAKHWKYSDEAPILFEEWLEYIEGDPEFRLASDGEKTAAGADAFPYGVGAAVWTKNAQGMTAEKTVLFRYHSGMAWIDVIDPDETILSKMRVVAKALSGRVVGQLGEKL